MKKIFYILGAMVLSIASLFVFNNRIVHAEEIVESETILLKDVLDEQNNIHFGAGQKIYFGGKNLEFVVDYLEQNDSLYSGFYEHFFRLDNDSYLQFIISGENGGYYCSLIRMQSPGMEVGKSTIYLNDYTNSYIEISFSYPRTIIEIGTSELDQLLFDCLYYSLSNEMELDFVAPDFHYSKKEFTMNIDNPLSINTILSNISATDNVDGDVSHNIDIINNYFVDDKGYGTDRYSQYPLNEDYSNLRVGHYVLGLQVNDISNNYAYLTIDLYIEDTSCPQVTGKTHFIAKNNVKLSLDKIIEDLKIEDNYILSEPKVTVLGNTYSGSGNLLNWKTLGDHYITFRITDSSGNYIDVNITVTVIDGTAPVVLDKDSNILKKTVIYKNPSFYLSKNEILKNVIIKDDIDGFIKCDLSMITIDEFTGNADKVGTYKIVLSIPDATKNKVEHTIEVIVCENFPQVYVYNNDVYSYKVKLTKEDFLNIVSNMGYIDVNSSSYSISIDTSNYEMNAEETGVYPVTIDILTNSGVDTTLNFYVNVVDPTDDFKINQVTSWDRFVSNVEWFFQQWWAYVLLFVVLGVVAYIFTRNTIK